MGIKTVPHLPYSPDLAPCDFWLFPKPRGGRYERIEEMKEAVTKVIDTLTQDDFHGALEKLLERYNKCIAAGGDYFERELSFMCVLSIKVPTRKKSGNLFDNPRTSPEVKTPFLIILSVWFGRVLCNINHSMTNPGFTYIINKYDLVYVGFLIYQPLLVI